MFKVFQKQTVIFSTLFFVLRLFSFFLFPFPLAQSLIIGTALLFFGVLLFKNQRLLWLVIFFELALGGSGHLFEFFGLSLRTILLTVGIGGWMIRGLWVGNLWAMITQNRMRACVLVLSLGAAVFAGATGFFHGHEPRAIVQDLFPFLLVLTVFPLHDILHEEKNRVILRSLFSSAIFCSAIYALLLFFLFSYGITEIHGDIYTWIRDAGMGKITDLGNGFFRIVFPEHLLVVPALLVLAFSVLKEGRISSSLAALLASGLLILALNFSRTYLLAFAISFPLLLYREYFWPWFRLSLGLAAGFFMLFVGISLIGSRGSATGLDLFGVRFGSIARPALEESASTRAVLFPVIVENIKKRPFLGHGIGSTIEYLHSKTGESITTRHLDWGYLELVMEFGALPLLFLLGFFLLPIVSVFRHRHMDFVAGASSLFLMTVTTPALFHVYGVLFFSALWAFQQEDR